MYEQAQQKYASSPYGVEWKTSPFLPIESMASRQYSLLVLLAIAHEQQIDVIPLVTAFAREHRRRFRSRLERFAARLRSNPCIASALEQTPELLPDDTVIAIRLGTDLGTLSETFTQLLETEVPGSDDVQEKWNSLISYAIVLIPTLGVIATGFLFFIAPTFKKMFDEFELRLPAVTVLYFSTANVVARFIGPCFFLFLVFTLLYLLTPLGLTLRRFYRRYLPGPFSSSSRRSVLQLLAISLRGQSSLKIAISTLAKKHPTPILRYRFRQAGKQIESGSDPWQCLLGQAILSPRQSSNLAAMHDDELRVWTLMRLASGKRAAERQRSYTLVSLVQPISILIIAIVVLWTCTMCFLPLVSIITSLS